MRRSDGYLKVEYAVWNTIPKGAIIDLHTDWTEADGISQADQGLDHLSLASVSENVYDRVTPGFTTLTNRARYYAFYCWVLHDYFGGGHEREAFEPFFRRREYAYALACVSHDHEPGTHGGMAIVGARTASRHWKSSENMLNLSVSHIKNKLGGFSNYRNAMQRAGLLKLSETQDSLTESVSGAPSGRALAEAFQSAIADTSYFKEYREEYEVPRSVIEEYGQAACLCRMSNAPDGEVLRRALLQPDPQVSDRALRGVHLSRTRTLALIFDSMSHCGNERMDDMAWRKLNFYRAFSEDRSYEPPESLDETALVWRMYHQRELHVYALTSLWSDLLWWLDENGPATLEERVAALDSEVDLLQAGTRFGLSPIRGRPSEISVRDLLDSIAAKAGVGDAFDTDETERIERAIGRGNECSERELHWALAWDDTLEAREYVATALWLSLVLYARTRHWGSEGTSTTAYITRMGDGRQWSVASFFAEIDRRRDGTALEFLAWIYRNLARQHLTVAMAKLPLDTFRLLYEDGLLYYQAPDWPQFTADRYDHMLAVCRDLGWIQETSGIYRLTPLGEKDQAQALGALV